MPAPRPALVLLLAMALALPAGAQNYSNARLDGQKDSLEKLAQDQTKERPGIMGQSKSLVGQAMGNAGQSIAQNIPSTDQVAANAGSLWTRTKSWCSQKWTALADWWNGRKP